MEENQNQNPTKLIEKSQPKTGHVLKLVVFSIIGLVISFTLVTLLTIGGGGFPSKFFLFFASLPMVILLLLYFLLIKNTQFAKSGYIIALFIFLSILQMYFFGVLTDINMREAQAYMNVLIPEVERFHNSNGYYPENLNFIDGVILEEARLKIKVSEDKWKVEGYNYQYRLGMFFLEYKAKVNSQEKPTVQIGRRDIQSTWNWEKGVWE